MYDVEKIKGLVSALTEGKLAGYLTDDEKAAAKWLADIGDNPLALASQYEAEFRYVDILGRCEPSPEDISRLAKYLHDEVYKDGEVSWEKACDFFENEHALYGDYTAETAVESENVPAYMLNPAFVVEMRSMDDVGAHEEDMILSGFFTKEEVMEKLKSFILSKVDETPKDGVHLVDLTYTGRSPYFPVPKALTEETQTKLLRTLLCEGEEIFAYAVDYSKSHAIRAVGSDDIGSALEDTLHRIIEEYGEELVYPIMGAYKASDEEICEPGVSMIYIDLGFVILGQFHII